MHVYAMVVDVGGLVCSGFGTLRARSDIVP